MSGENNNNFKRPEFLKDRVRNNPHNFPRPEFLKDRQIQLKPVEEIKKEEVSNDDSI